MSDELKPCPFCGSPAASPWIENKGLPYEEYVICCNGDMCDATIKGNTLSLAIKSWNRRAAEGQQP